MEFVEEALKKANSCYDYWQPIYDKGRDDLFFQSDDPFSQWDAEAVKSRKSTGRPVLTIDQTAQFVNQVSNDIRMNTPSIDIIPDGGGASRELADVLQGLIRNIEHKSNADSVYDNAVNFAVKCSIGYMRVDHDYADHMSFEQELYIERIINPFAVLFDSDSISSDGSDAKYCFVLEKMDIEQYKEKYPEASTASFTIADHYTSNHEKDEITLAEYFYIEEEEVTIFNDAGVVRVLEDGLELPKGIQARKTKKKTVHRCKLNGEEVLEKTTFPGQYIPIIPVYGEEAWQDGKRHLMSLIRRSKDSARMFNYLASMDMEMLMRSPKGRWIAAAGTTENYAEDYINPDKTAVYRYDQVDNEGKPAPRPEFVPPPQIPSGIVAAKQQATQDIRATMGLYDSYLGQQDNAISGVAIRQRQGEGNRAVFHFADNLVRSITHLGRVLVSAIPDIYDTPRVIRIIGKEDTDEQVGVNGMLVEGQDQHFYLSQGKFLVKVQTGASYSTMRQEASQAYQQMIAAQPQLMQIMGDLLFKYMDFPGAQAIAERFKKTMDPAILDDDLDPQVAQMQMQNQQLQESLQLLQGEIANLQQQLQDKQAEIQVKLQSEQYDAANDVRKYELDLERLRIEERNKIAQINLKQQELELRAYELGLKTSKQAVEQEREAIKDVVELATDVTERGVYD